MTINNLYVTYDEDGTKHFHINDEEVSEDVWMLRHPNMKGDKENGGNINSASSGRDNQGSLAADGPDAKVKRRQGLQAQRAKVKLEKAVADHVEGEDQR